MYEAFDVMMNMRTKIVESTASVVHISYHNDSNSQSCSIVLRDVNGKTHAVYNDKNTLSYLANLVYVEDTINMLNKIINLDSGQNPCGKMVRIKIQDGKISAVGHITCDDKWLDCRWRQR